jgi:glycosyltransferase involved in cell wall biosynthesis
MVTHTDVPYDNRILKEMEALASSAEGWAVRAIGVGLGEGNSAAAIPAGTTVDTLKLRSRTWSSLPKPIRYACTIIELLWKVVRRGVAWKPSVVHSHDTMVLPAAALVAWWCGAKLVYDAHELESDKNGGTAMLAWGTKTIERHLWSRVDLLVTVSPSIGNWYLDTFGPKPLAIVLNAPVHTDTPAPSRGSGSLRRRFGIAPAAPLCVYVGLLGRGRGLESLLEVFTAPHRRAHLVVVGYGELKEACEAAASRSSQVHVHDAVPHDKLVDLIRDADLGICLIERVSLSDYYCLPNKLFEYIAAGVPVLASDFPELRRVVETYSCGVVAGGGRDAMAAAITSIETHLPTRPKGLPTEMTWTAQARILTDAYARLSA